MGQPVVVIPAEPHVDNDASAAFAAGVAAATAVQANDNATQAADLAEVAHVEADDAARAAATAIVVAETAEDRIEALADRLDEVVEFLGAHFNHEGEPAAAQPDDTAPPVVQVEVNTTGKDPEPAPTKVKRERGGNFGSNAWWGNRK